MAEIVINDFFGAPFCEHNYPCCVCRTEKAVYLMGEGRFLPCWSCQRAGWRTARLPRWVWRLAEWVAP